MIEKERKVMSGSKRRSHLGIEVSKIYNPKLGTIEMFGTGKNSVSSDNVWKLLRRSKQLLAMRVPTAEFMQRLDYRKDWNVGREIESILDLFPSVKFSYSSLRGKKFTDSVKILSNGKKARIDDIARSHSIRLDPVEAPKELFKYRQRIQKIIEWSYANELVPVMMTLTLYHRWDYLDSLCNVLRSAWSELFRGSQGIKRKQCMGLRGYIRRMEETFNDGEDESETNAGWHPHYHVILLIPREKLQLVSEYEDTLKTVWVELVRKYYKAEFGEDIPSSYYETFRQHGLVFSRYKTDEHAARCGNANGKAGDLLEVHDGKYLAKIMGTDSPLYGGDTELTAGMQKNSKAPFDLLRGKVTASLADLWCEYALATKKMASFTFSHGLQKEVDTYFASVGLQSSVAGDVILDEWLVGRIAPKDYQWLYQHGMLGELLAKASEGYDALKVWLKENFSMDLLEDGNEVLSDCKVVDLSEGLPLSVADSELNEENIVTSFGNVSAYSEVLNFSKAGACGNPHQKRAKKFLISISGNKQNKSPPYVGGRNKAPPKLIYKIFNEGSKVNGRKELTVAENLSAISLEAEKTIEKLTAEIQYYLVQMRQNAIEIGKRLILAKAKLPHGEWQNWLEDNFNLSYKMAAKFMQVAERFSKVSTSRLFSQSQMFEMLSLPESETEKFIEVRALEGTPVDSMSIKKLREEIKKYKSGLTESKQEKNDEVEIEMADGLSTDQMPVVLSDSKENEDVVTAVEVEVADVDVEIPNSDIEEKVEEMPFECSAPSLQEENLGKFETSQVLKQSQSDITDKENEKSNEEYEDLEPLEQFFKFLPLILANVNLKSVVEKYAAKDLKEWEKQLGQLAAVHTEIENCLENWKNQQGAEMERQTVLSELKQIGLNDKEPFNKSKYVRDSIAELGFESVHKVPTKELLRILNEVKTQ